MQGVEHGDDGVGGGGGEDAGEDAVEVVDAGAGGEVDDEVGGGAGGGFGLDDARELDELFGGAAGDVEVFETRVQVSSQWINNVPVIELTWRVFDAPR